MNNSMNNYTNNDNSFLSQINLSKKKIKDNSLKPSNINRYSINNNLENEGQGGIPSIVDLKKQILKNNTENFSFYKTEVKTN
jgi:hypothetical protein